jgi:hypothetical protein
MVHFQGFSKTSNLIMSKGEVILNFHGIGNPSRQLTESEVSYWISAERFREIIDLCTFYDGSPFQVKLTFDDGNQSDVEIALPFLLSRKLAAKFMILSNYFDKPGFLSGDAVRDLANAGMTIGTHGLNHVAWPAISEAELRAELDESVAKLELLTGNRITVAGIPFGMYNRRVLAALRQRGFAEVYTSDGGIARSNSWLRPRTSVRSDMSNNDLERLLSGLISWRSELRRRISMKWKAWK